MNNFLAVMGCFSVAVGLMPPHISLGLDALCVTLGILAIVVAIIGADRI